MRRVLAILMVAGLMLLSCAVAEESLPEDFYYQVDEPEYISLPAGSDNNEGSRDVPSEMIPEELPEIDSEEVTGGIDEEDVTIICEDGIETDPVESIINSDEDAVEVAPEIFLELVAEQDPQYLGIGDVLKLRANIYGIEGNFKIEWQTMYPDSDWCRIDGAEGFEFEVLLDESNINNLWRFAVYTE